jgi:hypothetical protein
MFPWTNGQKNWGIAHGPWHTKWTMTYPKFYTIISSIDHIYIIMYIYISFRFPTRDPSKTRFSHPWVRCQAMPGSTTIGHRLALAVSTGIPGKDLCRYGESTINVGHFQRKSMNFHSYVTLLQANLPRDRKQDMLWHIWNMMKLARSCKLIMVAFNPPLDIERPAWWDCDYCD